MSDSMMSMLVRQLNPSLVGQISQQAGTDQRATNRVVAGAIPLMVQALANNASSGGGASSLAGALDRDHDGSILDDLAGFFTKSGGDSTAGGGILGHMLGSQSGAAAERLGKTSGLDAASVAKILAMLAPVVMAAAGRMKRTQGLDDSGLARQLEVEQKQVTQSPQLGGLASLLDRDGDGNVADDVMDMLGGFFKK